MEKEYAKCEDVNMLDSFKTTGCVLCLPPVTRHLLPGRLSCVEKIKVKECLCEMRVLPDQRKSLIDLQLCTSNVPAPGDRPLNFHKQHGRKTGIFVHDRLLLTREGPANQLL